MTDKKYVLINLDSTFLFGLGLELILSLWLDPKKHYNNWFFNVEFEFSFFNFRPDLCARTFTHFEHLCENESLRKLIW